MAFAVVGKVAGLDELKRALAGVDKRVRKTALRKGVTAGTKVVLDKAKAKVQRRSGLLAKSLGRKTKVFRNDGAVVGIVGPRVGFKKQTGVVKTGKKAGQPIMENPTQIAHLIEKGTRRSRAFPFMRPALDESKGEVARAVTEAVQAELHK